MTRYVSTPEYTGPVDDNGMPIKVYGLESFDPESSGLLEKFDIQESGEIGINSGRTKFSVRCRKCQCLLHPSTTDPSAYTPSHKCSE